MTRKQYDHFMNCKPDDLLLMEWMLDNGVEFDTGVIDVSIDGKPARIYTDKADFGTVELTEEERKLSPHAQQGQSASGRPKKEKPRAVKKQPPKASGYRRMEMPGE